MTEKPNLKNLFEQIDQMQEKEETVKSEETESEETESEEIVEAPEWNTEETLDEEDIENPTFQLEEDDEPDIEDEEMKLEEEQPDEVNIMDHLVGQDESLSVRDKVSNAAAKAQEALNNAPAPTKKSKRSTRKTNQGARTNLFDKAFVSFAGETITLEEAMNRAGANFIAAKCDIETKLPSPFTPQIKPYLVDIFDTETGIVLSNNGVGREYGLVQFLEAVQFCQQLLTEQLAEMTHVGAPGTRSHLYVVMRANGQLDIHGQKLEHYFTVTTAHDGSAKLNIRITPILNNLVFTPQMSQRHLSFKHSKRVADHMRTAKRTMAGVTKEWDSFSDNAKKFIKCNLTDEQARDYFKMIVGENDESTRNINTREMLFDLYKSGVVSKLVPNTLFTAYGAMVEYVNFDKTVRKSKLRPNATEAEVFTKIHGPSMREQTEAYGFAVEMSAQFNVQI